MGLFRKNSPKIVFLKNTFPVQIFLRNRPLTYFRGQTDYVARFEGHIQGQNCSGRKLRSILPRKPREIFFPKTRFRFEFFYETAPHLFLGPNGLYGTIGSKIVSKGSFVFPKNTFSVRIFLQNRPLTSLQENRFVATKPFCCTKVLISLLDVPGDEIVH